METTEIRSAAARGAELAIDAIDGAQLDRFVLFYVDPVNGLVARRLGPPPNGSSDPWVPVEALLKSPDAIEGIERMLDALWPSCPASWRREIIMGADISIKALRVLRTGG